METEALKLSRNLIRVGFVNSINAKKGTVQVLFPDKDNKVSNNLPLLSYEYHMPKVEDQVICLFLGNGLENGFCLGKFYSDINPPPQDDEKYYRKQFSDGTHIEYDKDQRKLKISAEKPLQIVGDLRIQGNLTVSGEIKGNNRNNRNNIGS